MGVEVSTNLSTSEYCHLYLRTDEMAYSPGSVVTGIVYVSVMQPFPTNMLELRVKGTEKVEWEEAKGPAGQPQQPGEGPNQQVMIVKEKKDIIDMFSPLWVFPTGILSAGNYEFPFQFTIFDYCPGTFDYRDVNSKGKIRYSLSAILRSTNPAVKDQKFKNHLIILQRPKLPPPKTSAEAQSSICCSGKGYTRIEGNFNSDEHTIGEDAIIAVRVDNSNCQINVSSITAKLVQRISFRKSRDSVKIIDRTLKVRDYNGLDGLKAGESTPQPITLNFKMENELIGAFSQGGVTFEYVQPCVRGTLIECGYTMYVTCNMEFQCGLCVAPPGLVLPFFLYYSRMNMPKFIQVPKPQNWSPYRYECKTMLLQPSLPSAQINVGGMGMQMNMEVPSVNVNMNSNMGMGMGVDMNMNTGVGVSMNVSQPVVDVQMNTGNFMDIQMNTGNVTMEVNNVEIKETTYTENVSMGMGNMNVEVKESFEFDN